MRDELRAEMKSEIRSVKNGNQLQIQVFRYFCILILGQAIIVPTFDTKVTEYLCSGGVFFLQTNFFRQILTNFLQTNFFFRQISSDKNLTKKANLDFN